jgi:DNA-binding transcriptional MocR family regulator
MTNGIQGTTAGEIADSIRDLRESGELQAGEPLPPVRALAERLGVNRNTVVAAYRQLANAGVVRTLGRGGTRVAGPSRVAQEGFAADSSLRDVGTGNPDPALIPPVTEAFAGVAAHPVLYGEPVVDEGLEAWARAWFEADLAPRDFDVTVTSGAVDAVERLLAQALLRGDAVALEDPCWLAGIQTARLGGYRTIPVSIDAEGMTTDGLRRALEAGARAVVGTPRAQNPTGVSVSSRRAQQLRQVLADYPYVLVIEDDHFSLLSGQPYHSIIAADHRRFALVRSVSKFLGPDMCLAVAATDAETASRLAMRLSPGTTWVSHLLQRLGAALLTDHEVREQIRAAGAHYAERNARFAALLQARGIEATAQDGLNLWAPVPTARAVSEQLMRRGWLARTEDEFRLGVGPSQHLRLTVHDLDDAAARQLADDVASAVRAVRDVTVA